MQERSSQWWRTLHLSMMPSTVHPWAGTGQYSQVCREKKGCNEEREGDHCWKLHHKGRLEGRLGSSERQYDSRGWNWWWRGLNQGWRCNRGWQGWGNNRKIGWQCGGHRRRQGHELPALEAAAIISSGEGELGGGARSKGAEQTRAGGGPVRGHQVEFVCRACHRDQGPGLARPIVRGNAKTQVGAGGGGVDS